MPSRDDLQSFSEIFSPSGLSASEQEQDVIYNGAAQGPVPLYSDALHELTDGQGTDGWATWAAAR